MPYLLVLSHHPRAPVMRCGYKTVVIAILILVDAAAVTGTILNLAWMDADVEQRRWLGWALLIADGLALILSVVVGGFHWARLRQKGIGRSGSQMRTFEQLDLDPATEKKDPWEATENDLE